MSVLHDSFRMIITYTYILHWLIEPFYRVVLDCLHNIRFTEPLAYNLCMFCIQGDKLNTTELLPESV